MDLNILPLDGTMVSFTADLTTRNAYHVFNTNLNIGRFEFSQSSRKTDIKIIIREVSLEPYFTPVDMGVNGFVSPSNALLYDDMISFISGIKHLYNLKFVTDEVNKIVYIEPDNTFHDGIITDWRSKEHTTPLIEEIGANLGKRFILKYPDDALTSEYLEYGQLITPMEHNFADTEDLESENPFFTGTVVRASARNTGMQLAQVDDEGNFSCRILKYIGTQGMSDDGAYPSTTSYPLLSFVGYDDLSYYDRVLNLYNKGRRITMDIDLKTKDIEGFANPNSLKRDFRGKFLIHLDDDILCDIESIDFGDISKVTFIYG